MELELTRLNYTSVNTTMQNCLKLISTGSLKKQKIAVGDLDGNFQMFGVKNSEVQLAFQNIIGSKVSSVQISGVAGTFLDKIFVGSDKLIKGFTKKGKIFMSFDTNLTEPLKCMFVSGADLFICGNHVYSHYRDCKEIGTYLCGDTIVDIVALLPNNENVLTHNFKYHIRYTCTQDENIKFEVIWYVGGKYIPSCDLKKKMHFWDIYLS